MNINNSFVLIRLHLRQWHLHSQRAILRHPRAQQLRLQAIRQNVLPRVLAVDLITARVVDVDGVHLEDIVVDYLDAQVLGLVAGEVEGELQLFAVVGLVY